MAGRTFVATPASLRRACGAKSTHPTRTCIARATNPAATPDDALTPPKAENIDQANRRHSRTTAPTIERVDVPSVVTARRLSAQMRLMTQRR